MSWLNFNDSLNSIKGQISTFANNVLAEEEGQENKELQELCQQQQLEIKKLKEFIEDSKSRQTNHPDGSNGSWNWDGDQIDSKTSAEPVSALKKTIASLETEKAELLAQLEQLDADNQENLVVINDKYQKVKEENKNLTSEIEKLKDKEEETNPDKKIADINQKLSHELEELQKELFVVKSSNESFQKIIEDTKKGGGDETSEKYKKLECENKVLYAELKKANEQITFFEKKSLEDEDNCQKLAFILETYEKQVSSLKKELKDIGEKYDEVQNQQKETEKMKNENDHKRHATDLKTLQEQLNGLKEHSSPEEIERFNREIWESYKLNEDLLIKGNGRIDMDGFEHDQQNYESELNVLREKLERLKSYTDRRGNSSSKDVDKDSEQMEDPSKGEIQRLQPQSAEDAKLIHMLKNQIEEIEQLKEEIGKLKTLNEDLLVKASGRMDMDLEDELENIQQEHEAQIEVLREELDQLRNQENKNIKDVEKFEELEEEKIELARELNGLQLQYEFLQESHKVSLHELHNKYINIITENIKKFQECEKPSDFEHCVQEDDPQVAELSKHIENIIKILLDLKCKCSDLEKRILEISEEKNNILLEKNHEIEKLIQNSDMLSQEIVSKNQSIKEYENECNDIAKNNELLITELETYKANPVLQTISESNEDNMILLEVQLENANKRIEDLEKVIDDLEKQQRKQSIESDNVDLENALEQLNKTEMEINTKSKDYEDLLNNFDQLQIHYESMKNELAENKERSSYLNDENSNLRSALEKLKSEYESLEYQISEVNVNSESLKEETDEFKLKFKSLLSENSSLKLQNEDIVQKTLDYESNIDVLNEKLAIEEEQRKNLESQIENLTEKLKNFKMAETSLKLQCEQKNKELAAQSEARYNLEVSLNKMNADLAEFQNNFVELQSQNDKMVLEQEQLRDVSSKKDEKLKELEDSVKVLEDKTKTSFELIENPTENRDYTKLKQILDETVLEKANLHTELNKLAHVQSQLKEATDRCETLHKQLKEVTVSRNELINMVTMKHQENVTYHNEIQRLNQVLAAEVEKYRNLEQQLKEATVEAVNKEKEEKSNEIEKLNDQNSFLKEKCEVLTKNLLEEQSKVQQLLAERSTPSEKEITLQKNLDRLQTHLIELEEHYTQELYQAEQKNQTLKARVGEIEERAKSSSTMYTSVSIRANQQVESLQSQLQTVIQERDSLRKQISDAEDQTTKQAAALANLQFVLEQFRKDKDQDIIKETERIRRHIHKEKQVQEELKVDISNLKSQLEERNQGLLAASRLSDQLESSKKTISGLKEEVSQLQSKLSRTEDELKDALSTTDGKVDKLLIKNLILGFVTSNNTMNRDQSQILKIIATVLDFNQQDHDKVKLNKPQQGWLASFLAPQPENQNKLTEESLSRAFIKFLENESKPRVVPSLLNNSSTLFEPSSTKTTNSRSTTPGQTTPIVLSEIVLPTFSDFAQNRNSSSILKDVLKDNS